MIEKFFTALYADENVPCFDEDSGNAGFNCNEIGTLNIDLNNINRDNNFDEDDLVLLFMLVFWLGILNLKKAKHLKKYK